MRLIIEKNNMALYNIKDDTLRQAASEGMDSFVSAIVDAIKKGIGGELSAETMPKLSSDQITLLGYVMLRDEIMDGGFVQLIHNGYGPFYFHNPFDLAIRQWGLVDLCRLMRRAKKMYQRNKDVIEKEMSDEEFMALYEKMDVFEDFDDEFVSNEELWTEMVARYLDENLDKFVTISVD